MRVEKPRKAFALKKAYSKPMLKKFGSVAQLTSGVGGSNLDRGQTAPVAKKGFG